MVRAEGVGDRSDAGPDRVHGAATLISTPVGLVAIGGPALRRLAPGARRWETLHTVAGDNLYRVASDDAGRLLASWSRERAIHLITPASRQVVSFPKPAAPPDVQSFQIASLAFLPGGREALVFMTGEVRVSTARFRGARPTTSAYRIDLQGKTEPALLFRVDHGYQVHGSRYGAVFAMPKNVEQRCDHRECPVAAIVAYQIVGGAVNKQTLFDGQNQQVGRVRSARGGGDGRVTLLLETSSPRRLDLLRWRYGDATATVSTRPGSPDLDRTTFLVTRSDAVLEVRVQDGLLEIARQTPAGAEPVANLGELQDVDTGLHGIGERGDGTLWLHWGDHIGLVSPGQPPRSYSIKHLVSRRSEWAGVGVYVPSPEVLWVGIDGAGRHFERVSFADVERAATPWAPGSPIERTRGEYAGYDPKDPSTADRLYNAAGLREMRGGLYSLGGAALRRFVNGARKWETLHAIPKDNLYRVAADDDGRLLAAWEKDPDLHLFSADGGHVRFPKPVSPAATLGPYQVDHLSFLPGGRDALVIVQGQLKNPPSRHVPEPVRFYYASWATEAYRVPLDGKLQPQLLYREDYGHRIHDSRRGSLFALPKHAGQECDHTTCFPITEIIAYEITPAGVRRQTILRGDGWGPGYYLSSAVAVRGSGDERVAMVLGFTRNQGKLWLNGGRGLVRWRWGQAGGDYRPLPGNGSITPRWLLTRNDDFIELLEHWDTKPDRLEVKRYLAGGGEQSIILTALMKMASPYGLGERAGTAGLWLQWGEHIAFLPHNQTPRSFHLDPLVQRGTEWAGAHAYVSTPESLWVGLDGRGRSYARVDLADAERRSKPWR
jgi:hypothetical protein